MRLRPEHIRYAAKKQRSKGRSQQRGGIDEALLNFAYVPQRLEERHHDADDEQVVTTG